MAGRTGKLHTVKYSDHYVVVSVIIASAVGSAEGSWVKGTQEERRL